MAVLSWLFKESGNTLDVKEILNTWILQMNYPVVNVTKTESGKIRLTQERFLKNKNAKDPGVYISPYKYLFITYLK